MPLLAISLRGILFSGCTCMHPSVHLIFTGTVWVWYGSISTAHNKCELILRSKGQNVKGHSETTFVK